MNLCSHGHDEVCFEASLRFCPVCELQKQYDELEETIKEANAEKDEMEKERDELAAELAKEPLVRAVERVTETKQ